MRVILIIKVKGRSLLEGQENHGEPVFGEGVGSPNAIVGLADLTHGGGIPFNLLRFQVDRYQWNSLDDGLYELLAIKNQAPTTKKIEFGFKPLSVITAGGFYLKK